MLRMIFAGFLVAASVTVADARGGGGHYNRQASGQRGFMGHRCPLGTPCVPGQWRGRGMGGGMGMGRAGYDGGYGQGGGMMRQPPQ